MFLPPDLVADLVEEPFDLLLRHATLFDLLAKRGQQFIGRGLTAQFLLQGLCDKLRYSLPAGGRPRLEHPFHLRRKVNRQCHGTPHEAIDQRPVLLAYHNPEDESASLRTRKALQFPKRGREGRLA
jgi:hypothetical protein